MKQKLFLQIVGVILAVKAVFGALYLILGWNIAVGGWVIPTWLVVVAVIVDGYLSYLACKFSKAKK
jgi:hypothetical protein